MTRVDHLFQKNTVIRAAKIGKKQSDPLAQLLPQFLAAVGDVASTLRTTSRPWASALFEGHRHMIELLVEGDDAQKRIAAFAEGLEEAEWLLSGHFVADICIDDCRDDDGSGVKLHLSALTIEDW